MAKQFSKFLYKNILQEQDFLDLYKDLLVNYTKFLVNNNKTEGYELKYNKLLRYADILSLSDNEDYQNMAQQIVIILSQIFPNNEKIKIFKENVYKNVSNFASIDLLLKEEQLLSNNCNNFLSDLV